MPDSAQTRRLAEQAAAGDERAFADLLTTFRPRLARMVRLRLDRRLQGRVAPSDVLQEAFIELVRRLPRYVAQPTPSMFVWIRLVTAQKLLQIHRRHLATAKRDAGREVPFVSATLPADSRSLAVHLQGHFSTPSEEVARAERQACLQQVIEGMDAIDREVLALRHFEELTNGEVAESLRISKAAASKRYVQAIRRLRQALLDEPGFQDEID